MPFFRFKNAFFSFDIVTSVTFLDAEDDAAFSEESKVKLYISPSAGLAYQTITLSGDDALRVRRYVLSETMEHYHAERHHEGIGGRLIRPEVSNDNVNLDGQIECRERLGGLLRFYSRSAA